MNCSPFRTVSGGLALPAAAPVATSLEWLRRQRFFGSPGMKPLLLALLAFVDLPLLAKADSQAWSFRENFIYDPWNTPIMPYLATFPPGRPIRVENLRAMISPADLARLRAAAVDAVDSRVVKRVVIESLDTDAAVQHARRYLLGDQATMAADVFKTAAGYADKFGLLAILEVVAKWQCAADETCPEKIAGKLETLLARGGRIMKTETFLEIGGEPYIIALVTYEVSVGQEVQIVPLRSRKLQVATKR